MFLNYVFSEKISQLLESTSIQLDLQYSSSEQYSTTSNSFVNYEGYRLSLNLNPDTAPGQTLECVLDMYPSYLILRDDRLCSRECLNCNANTNLNHKYDTCYRRNSSLAQVERATLKIAEPLIYTGGADFSTCYKWILCSNPSAASTSGSGVGTDDSSGSIPCDIQPQLLDKISLQQYPTMFQMNISALSTGQPFQWDYLRVSSMQRVSPKCRLGLFSPVGLERTSLFDSLLKTAQSKIVYLDVNQGLAADKIIVGDLSVPANVVWSNRRLRLGECYSDSQTFLYSFQVCGNNLLLDQTALVLSFSLTHQYLDVPKSLYDRIVSYFPVKCQHQEADMQAFCQFIDGSIDLDKIKKQTAFSFTLSQQDGSPTLHVPMSQLVRPYNGKYYLVVMNHPPTGTDSFANYETIMLGSRIVESMHFYIDYGESRIGLRNKLLNTTTHDKLAQPLCTTRAAPPDLFQAYAITSCVKNGYRSYDSKTGICDLTISSKVVLSLGFVLFTALELLTAIKYQYTISRLQSQKIFT